MASRRKRSRAEILSTLKRVIPYLKPHRSALARVAALIIVVNIIGVVFPALMGRIIDDAGKPDGWSQIKILLLVYFVALAARTLSSLARNRLMQITGMSLTCNLRVAVFSHLQKLSIRFYEERQTGRVVARVTEDAASLNQLITGASATLLADLVSALGVFFLLFTYSWKLALISLVVAPCFVFNYAYHRRRMRMESRRHRRHWFKMVGYLNERIANNRIIRAFAAEDAEEEAFREDVAGDFNNFNRVQWRNTLLSTVAEFISSTGQFLALAFGAYLMATSHTLTRGQLVAFLAYLGMVYGPITRLFDLNTVVQAAATSLERIFAILDTKPHIPDNDALPELPRMRGKIEFRDVSFGYRIGQATLDHVNFTVQPGEMVALVGASGAGKSTITTLLARFYDPSGGEVLLDDKPITDYNVQSVRRQIGIVMQESILFSGTIGDNIRYGRPNATQAEVVAAAKAANIHDFVSELRNGYDSRVGERGVTLSGGQRQRVAIARVLLKDPRILILDEATSSLDSQSERLIQEATEKLMTSRTALVIAHRLSTVVKADRILVMERGRIVDQGTHAQLLARPGIYQDLYRIQFEERAA